MDFIWLPFWRQHNFSIHRKNNCLIVMRWGSTRSTKFFLQCRESKIIFGRTRSNTIITKELSPYKEKMFLNGEVWSSTEKFSPQRRSLVLNREVWSSTEKFFLNGDVFLQYRRFLLHEKKGSTKNKFVIRFFKIRS